MYVKTIKQPFNIDLKNSYLQYRNILNELTKESKNLYCGSQIIKAGENSKELWNCIKEASNMKTNKQTGINQIFDEHVSIVSDKKEIANIFNTFFVNVGISISDDIKKHKYKMCDWKELNKNCYINNNIFFRLIDAVELTNYINKSNDRSSFYEGSL